MLSACGPTTRLKWQHEITFAHPSQSTVNNLVIPLELLNDQDMVFICIDAKAIKGPIIEALEAQGTPFIDVGMGVELIDGGLTAMLRTTTSTPDHRDHVRNKNRIPMASEDQN